MGGPSYSRGLYKPSPLVHPKLFSYFHVTRALRQVAQWDHLLPALLRLTREGQERLHLGHLEAEEPTDSVTATCIVYPCTKDYSRKIKEGTLLEKMIRERFSSS